MIPLENVSFINLFFSNVKVKISYIDYSQKFFLWLYSNTRQQVVAVDETRCLADFLILTTCKTILDTDFATQ